MELAEMVELGFVSEFSSDCPFDHSEKPPTYKNVLIGDGQELGKKMLGKESTCLSHLKEEIKQAILDPRQPPRLFRAITITFRLSEKKTQKFTYPVTCAAHHCIPGQESLKGHAILQYMCKKGEPNDLKGAKYSKGKVWANVGYDVNGSENGVYLPGSYAVGGGKGGTGQWTKSGDPDNEEPPTSGPNVGKLTGKLNQVSYGNRKWLYVSKAVASAPGQFHDRHVDYSNEVKGILTAIKTQYDNLYHEMVAEGKCPDCKKRAEQFKTLGFPTPFGLVARLNKVSERMKTYLNGATWKMNIYTSKWGKAYMDARAANNKAADAGND